MSNNALLIQHVSGNIPHINLMRVTASRHLEYCLRHKFDCELIVSGEPLTQGNWDVVRMVRTAMELHYQYIVYLDVDTVIMDLEADLREGCPPGHIGMCRHVLTKEKWGIDLDHFNVGAVYYSVCPETKAFVDKWLAGAPGTPEAPWWEQGVANRINDGTILAIDDKYNATPGVNMVDTPVVRGFHGQGDVLRRYNLMLEALGK